MSDLPEYVPPGEWPSEAWAELLDRYFEKAIDTPEAPVTHRYVLLRIPVDEFDRLTSGASFIICNECTGKGYVVGDGHPWRRQCANCKGAGKKPARAVGRAATPTNQ